MDDNSISNALSGFLPEGMAKPAVIAIGALLLKHMMESRNAPQAAPQAEPQSGGLGGGLGGALGGALAGGGLLGGLGGLLNSLRGAGQGPAVNSWVGTGQNQPIPPQQIGQSIGQKTLSEIAARTGMSEQELLQILAQNLPQAVDRLTPNGQLPGGFGRI